MDRTLFGVANAPFLQRLRACKSGGAGGFPFRAKCLCRLTCSAPTVQPSGELLRLPATREHRSCRLQGIGGAAHSPPAAAEGVSVDHRRAHVPAAQKLLDRANVMAVLEKMGGKRVPEGVAGRRLADAGPARGILDGTLSTDWCRWWHRRDAVRRSRRTGSPSPRPPSQAPPD